MGLSAESLEGRSEAAASFLQLAAVSCWEVGSGAADIQPPASWVSLKSQLLRWQPPGPTFQQASQYGGGGCWPHTIPDSQLSHHLLAFFKIVFQLQCSPDQQCQGQLPGPHLSNCSSPLADPEAPGAALQPLQQAHNSSCEIPLEGGSRERRGSKTEGRCVMYMCQLPG